MDVVGGLPLIPVKTRSKYHRQINDGLGAFKQKRIHLWFARNRHCLSQSGQAVAHLS